ncbi:hypothetical protein HALLA_10760 [Halostagnicola larsenii XH-48]|uniref:Phycocyanin alpha phycocyanobilin lyase n=1 Tax=Halostagnicola larsenii XH-48 TaxID=797299 RepID=W0JKJ3_9EURY|nr:HEAT repeat domain-containing protein [Halostagnicola larsenii]AHF99265.1 hypothetical protein HALLA_10760 [Halostagnicola larsenii XH-48]
MDSDGGMPIERSTDAVASFELPTILARLDGDDPASRKDALETVRETVDTRPDACLPTVPKLRKLLETGSTDDEESIAYCLAELARESPDDVAPSVPGIQSCLTATLSQQATRDLFRCLHAVAEARPDTVIDHIDELVGALEDRAQIDRWGVELLAELSKEYPGEITPALPVLREVLRVAPQHGGVSALTAIGRAVRTDTVSTFAFVDDVVSVVDHDDPPLRNNALACLGDVAAVTPSAVEPYDSAIATALESDDPNTRANAAVTIGRLAADTNEVQAQRRLIELLSDDHAQVRANACTAIGYGQVGTARNTLENLADGDPNPAVRERAAWASAQL